MMPRLYRYVGPEEFRIRARSRPAGRRIGSPDDVRRWIADTSPETVAGLVAATFVIDLEGWLLLADRRSEHVACAGGEPVLAAGEIFFSPEEDLCVEEASNLSTGYCPEPGSWGAVREALERLGLVHPGGFTTEVIFRLCEACGQRNAVKDGWYRCQVCGAELSRRWNFG